MLTVEDLFVAVNMGNIHNVRFILQNCTFDMNVCHGGETLLHTACKGGDNDNMLILLNCYWSVIR